MNRSRAQQFMLMGAAAVLLAGVAFSANTAFADKGGNGGPHNTIRAPCIEPGSAKPVREGGAREERRYALSTLHEAAPARRPGLSAPLRNSPCRR